MKLIVQIPCFNEEETLPATVADIPRRIDGIDVVEILIIDDGSSDKTTEVASQIGVDHIVENAHNLGLARSFARGLEECLKRGADIVVNTDGDNQYCGADIAKLVQPILKGEAELVVGDRNTQRVEHFSPIKKLLQNLGSRVVRNLSGVNVDDAVSGFRAISREAALRINIVSSFSYTTEMLIQAGKKQISVVAVPVKTNKKTRESRLFRNIPQFITQQLATMLRMYVMYRPLRFFFALGAVLTLIGMLPVLRFMYAYFTVGGAGHIQSLVLGGTLLLMGFAAFIVGLVADIINFNRQLIEITLEKARKQELSSLDD